MNIFRLIVYYLTKECLLVFKVLIIFEFKKYVNNTLKIIKQNCNKYVKLKIL